jgi:hypothetical protein
MLRVRYLQDEDDPVCHECGKRWYQHWRPDDPLMLRPYAELRGSIGCCLVLTVLCPPCADEILEAAFAAAHYGREKVEASLAWHRDELAGMALGDDRCPPLLRLLDERRAAEWAAALAAEENDGCPSPTALRPPPTRRR